MTKILDENAELELTQALDEAFIKQQESAELYLESLNGLDISPRTYGSRPARVWRWPDSEAARELRKMNS